MSRADRRGATTRWVEDDFEYDRRPASKAPPSFLNEDYGRGEAGAVVLRDKTVIEDDISRSSSRRDDRRHSVGDRRVRPGERRYVEEDEVLITSPRRRGHSTRASEAPRERIEDDRTEVLYRERKNGRRESDVKIVSKEEVSYRPRRQPSPPPLAREREEWVFHHPERPVRETEQITIRERDRAPPAPAPPPPREREEIDIRISEREREREPPRRPRSAYHEDDIRITERDGRGYHEDEIDIRERDRAPPPPSPPRSQWDEEIRISQKERERPRPRIRYEDEEDIRIRERSRPGYKDEEIDIRRRSQSRGPAPSRRGWDEEIDIRERERSGRGYSDDEIEIRERERARRRAPPPSSYDDEEEIRIRDRSRPGYRDRDISIRERERSRPRPPPSRYSEESIDIKERDRRGGREEEIDIRRRSRSRPPVVERERDVVIRRRSSPSPEPVRIPRRARSLSSERSKEELVIKRNESRHGRKEEIIIRREKSKSPSPERSPSPPPIREPDIIRAPAIHQEVITHHRHIDHGFEVVRPEPRAPSPPPAPKTVYDEEIDIRRRGERDGRRYDDSLEIDRKIREAPERPRARTPLPEVRPRERSSPPPPRPKSSLEVDIRLRNDRNGDRFEEDVRVMDGVRNSRNMAPRERAGAEIVLRGGRRYVGSHPVEDRMWTEITKDLVVREALESHGYEVEETEHFFYVMEYLRYEDMARLVSISNRIRNERKDRIRQIEWERRHPPGLPAPRPHASDRQKWDEERIYERDIYYDRPRPSPRPLPPRAPPSPLPPRKETEEVMVKIR